MTTVGIIANPASGKDIRRLVAHGSVFDNQEKVRIVRRLLTGLEATGVDQVCYLADGYAIVERAVRGCSVALNPTPIPITVRNNQTDSTRAAAWMEANGVGAVVVLGGDGTCRAVAKGTVQLPLLPVSTGTNNVFPYMIEATVGGLAAGLIATGRVPRSAGVFRSCQLEVLCADEVADIALVDVAVYNDRFVAARAIWDITKVSQIFLTRARPDAIGLSAIGGQLATLTAREPRGLHLVLGGRGRRVTAPIAPGLLQTVSVAKEEFMQIGRKVTVQSAPCVLALDGEREVNVKRGQEFSVRLSAHGPLVIDLAATMAHCQQHGLLATAASPET